MLSRHCQKIGALLGMVAILLSVIAPTISQVLRSAQTEHHSHHHWHQEQLAVEAIHFSHVGAAAHRHGPDSSLLCDACPYCGVITHAPAMPAAPLAFTVANQHAQFSPPISTTTIPPYTVVTPAQPRAPPALS
jgi:Protein of unknown function (DUF2946)